MNFKVKFKQNSKKFKIGFNSFQMATERVGAEYYEGEYEITPKVESQIMPTAQKTMTDDVTVHAIPYFDVSNHAGGSTVYIGSEVMIYGN